MRKKGNNRPTINRFLALEAELMDSTLCDERRIKAEAEMKEICERIDPKLFPSYPDYERFAHFYMRWKSSGDFVDHSSVRSHLLHELVVKGAQKQNRDLTSARSRRWDENRIRDRDLQMAREFERLKGTSRKSDTALKAEIGRRQSLGRTQSVEAINRGIKLLAEQEAARTGGPSRAAKKNIVRF
jgi:hypothetical protein